ncbi:hypothetical protein GYH30_044695 [Glycine max]|uniref:Uncharacterized protein n=1 Tax=Glycine max TaxID=3847 RepID=A0A0R0G0I5_SOYBN|nr:hypothetical protein GYH30_044695 [Glycine max]
MFFLMPWEELEFILVHSLKGNKTDPKRAEFVDMQDPFDDGAGLLKLTELSLDESNLEVVLFLKMVNGREENDTISIR